VKTPVKGHIAAAPLAPASQRKCHRHWSPYQSWAARAEDLPSDRLAFEAEPPKPTRPFSLTPAQLPKAGSTAPAHQFTLAVPNVCRFSTNEAALSRLTKDPQLLRQNQAL